MSKGRMRYRWPGIPSSWERVAKKWTAPGSSTFANITCLIQKFRSNLYNFFPSRTYTAWYIHIYIYTYIQYMCNIHTYKYIYIYIFGTLHPSSPFLWPPWTHFSSVPLSHCHASFLYSMGESLPLSQGARAYPAGNVETLGPPHYPIGSIWSWYIYLHEWLILMVNVGKYTSPMDCLGHDPQK